jgi:hypothetical protein
LRNSSDIISSTGGFYDFELAVLANTLNQDLANCMYYEVELVVAPLETGRAHAIKSTYLQIQTRGTLARSGDSGG